MNLSEIDYNNIDEDELYRMIFKECNINDFFINQSTVSYNELKNMLAYTMLENGISKIMSADDTNKLINSINERWIIDENSVTSSMINMPNMESQIYGKNTDWHSMSQLKKLDDYTLQKRYGLYIIDSGFQDEARNLGFEDMPIILENGNREELLVNDETYKVVPNGEDILESETRRSKYTSLNEKDFEEFKNNFSEKTMQEAVNLPDEYFNKIDKTDYMKNKSFNELEPTNVEKSERKQYTAEEFSQMAESVANRVDLGNREQVIDQSLIELGVSEKLLNPTIKDKIYSIVEKSIENSGEISDLNNKDQIELLLKQLNKDLIIKENYIAGCAKTKEEFIEKTANAYQTNISEVDRNDAIEIYIGEDGTYHLTDIANVYVGSEKSTAITANSERSYIANNDNLEPVVERQKRNEAKASREEYNQSTLNNMDIDSALAIKNRPNSMWQTIKTTLMRPEIIISQMIQNGRNFIIGNQTSNRENNSIQPSTIISSSDQNSQQGPGYNNFKNEVTEQDIKEAERVIATRSNAAKSGAASQIAENSEQTLQYVNEYIEGDAESQAAKVANEEERSQQQRAQQEENITK